VLATYGGLPNGIDRAGTILYVNGQISSLGGTVQEDTEITIASSNDMIITNNLRYSDYTPASGTPGTPGYVAASAEETTNLLGLISWSGNVRIATSAPDNIDIHGTVMAPEGIFSVDNYDNQSVGSRGVATLLGGAITDNYGVFGQFSNTTGATTAGYGRNFVYDNRMLQGKAPPYYPTLGSFTAVTNDVFSNYQWQEK
jgi:hypothetical protein